MGWSYWFRVATMIATFLAVTWTIRQLNQPVGQETDSAFNRMAKLFSPNQNSEQVVLCPNRVTSIELESGFVLFQEGLKWFRSLNGQKNEVDSLSVEKWFGLHCYVKAQADSQSENPSVAARFMSIKLIDGGQIELKRATDGKYLLDNQKFASPQLDLALKELEDLPVRPEIKN